MYLIRGGDVALDVGALRYAGNNGFFWSATAYRLAIHAFNFTLNDAIGYLSINNLRWFGLTVRVGLNKISRNLLCI